MWSSMGRKISRLRLRSSLETRLLHVPRCSRGNLVAATAVERTTHTAHTALQERRLEEVEKFPDPAGRTSFDNNTVRFVSSPFHGWVEVPAEQYRNVGRETDLRRGGSTCRDPRLAGRLARSLGDPGHGSPKGRLAS